MNTRATVHTFRDTVALFPDLMAAIENATEPGGLVAMPTGNTPLPLYERIRNDRGRDSRWRRYRYLQLDEYVDPPANTELFRDYLKRELLDPLDVPEENRLLIPVERGIETAARHMDGVLRSHGPLSTTVLGLGHNGHIAFNEPASSFPSGYHRVHLSPHTVRHNLQLDMELDAITISVEQILASDRIFLVVTQPAKLEVLERALKGPADPMLPASALIDHPGLGVYRIQ